MCGKADKQSQRKILIYGTWYRYKEKEQVRTSVADPDHLVRISDPTFTLMPRRIWKLSYISSVHHWCGCWRRICVLSEDVFV
jgi:hypothetical protein